MLIELRSRAGFLETRGWYKEVEIIEGTGRTYAGPSERPKKNFGGGQVAWRKERQWWKWSRGADVRLW